MAQIVPAPDSLPGFPEAERVRPKGSRRRWKDRAGQIYEWDYQHGAVEVYNARGEHQGEYDPVTREQLKGPVANRKVEP